MMTVIVYKLTAVKKTSKIISKQVLVWPRRVKVQKAQKVLIEATKDNKESKSLLP